MRAIAVVTVLAFGWAMMWPTVARAGETKPAPVAEDPLMASARQHFEAGRSAFNANDFVTAIREFKSAEALRPSPLLDYNIGLANERLARKRVAIRYFRRYLDGAPAAKNRAEVEARIAQLEREIAAQPQAQPPEQPADNPPPPPTTTTDPNAPPPSEVAQPDPYAAPAAAPVTTAPAPKKKHVMWWVWMLVGIGAAAVTAAIIVGIYYAAIASADTGAFGLEVVRPPPAVDRGAAFRVPSVREAPTAPIFTIHF